MITISRRPGRAAMLAAALALAAFGVAMGKEQRNARQGAPFDFALDGNPGTGYVWKVDVAASSGLELVTVEALGYSSQPARKPLKLGAPAQYLFRITCVGAGFANLHFNYVSPAGTVSERHETWVRCE